MKQTLLSLVLVLIFSFPAFAADYICTEYSLENDTKETTIFFKNEGDIFTLSSPEYDFEIPMNKIYEDLSSVVLIAKFIHGDGMTASILINKTDLTFGTSNIRHPFDITDNINNINTSGKCVKN